MLDLHPEQWKNVGVSLIQAIRAIRDHSLQTTDNLQTLKQFMDIFLTLTLEFIRNNEQEMTVFKKQIEKDVKTFSTKIQDDLITLKMGVN